MRGIEHPLPYPPTGHRTCNPKCLGLFAKLWSMPAVQVARFDPVTHFVVPHVPCTCVQTPTSPQLSSPLTVNASVGHLFLMASPPPLLFPSPLPCPAEALPEHPLLVTVERRQWEPRGAWDWSEIAEPSTQAQTKLVRGLSKASGGCGMM